MTITNEDDEHAHLLEMFDADAITIDKCPECRAFGARFAHRGIEVVGISCPWCQYVEWLDEEGLTDGQ